MLLDDESLFAPLSAGTENLWTRLRRLAEVTFCFVLTQSAARLRAGRGHCAKCLQYAWGKRLLFGQNLREEIARVLEASQRGVRFPVEGLALFLFEPGVRFFPGN